jgi:hypothetical protein
MRDVMLAVPGVLREQEIHGLRAPSGMAEFAGELLRCERAEKDYPARMEIVDQCERRFDRRGFSVRKLGPQIFVIGLDGGLVLGERELEAREGVHVAVADVVYELADSPAAWTIGRVKLGGRKASDGGAETRGDFGDGFDRGAASVGR